MDIKYVNALIIMKYHVLFVWKQIWIKLERKTKNTVVFLPSYYKNMVFCNVYNM